MQLMRAIFRCEKGHLSEIAEGHERETGSDLDLTIHEESPDGEAMVSGDIFSVMRFIGAVAARGMVLLEEAWVYEC